MCRSDSPGHRRRLGDERVRILQRSEQRLNGVPVAAGREGNRGGHPNLALLIAQALRQRRGGGPVPEDAQTLGGADPEVGIGVLQLGDQRRDFLGPGRQRRRECRCAG